MVTISPDMVILIWEPSRRILSIYGLLMLDPLVWLIILGWLNLDPCLGRSLILMVLANAFIMQHSVVRGIVLNVIDSNIIGGNSIGIALLH